MNTRVGQWKFSDLGAVCCIAEGGGYVMARNRGRLPVCFEVTIWDEMFDYNPSSQDLELKPHPQ